MSSEVLLLIPPMLCDARVFAHQIAAISRDHAVQVAFTRSGERMKDIATHVLDHAPPRFALAGMGMGGMVAMEILRRAANRVTRLALIGTNPLSDTPEISANREPLIIAARTGRMKDVIAAELNPCHLAPDGNRAAVMALVTDMAHGIGGAAYVRQARAMQRRRDQQDVLCHVKCPALVVCGEHDGLNTIRRHEFMAEMIPYAKLEIVADAGHLPTIEQPEACTALLQKWMGEPLVLR